MYHSFSADSEIISSFHFDPNPYPSSNSSILSSLLNQKDGLIAPNSSSQTLSCGSGTFFSHPPAQIVEDVSNRAGSHIVPSTAESTNWFGPQENLLDLWNPPILSPVSQNSISLSSHQDPPILSPVQQVVQPPLMFQQHIPSHHPCIPNDFWFAEVLHKLFISCLPSQHWHISPFQSGFSYYFFRQGCPFSVAVCYQEVTVRSTLCAFLLFFLKIVIIQSLDFIFSLFLNLF